MVLPKGYFCTADIEFEEGSPMPVLLDERTDKASVTEEVALSYTKKDG